MLSIRNLANSRPPRLSARDTEVLLLIFAGLCVVAPTIVRYYWPAGGWVDVTGHPLGRDFINVWIGPQVFWSNGLETLYNVHGYHAALNQLFGAELKFHLWSYPPFVLPFYWPLAQMPYALALTSWTVVFGYFFLAAATKPFDRSKVALGACLIALSPAALMNLVGGQNGFLTAGLLITSILLLDRRPWLSGVLIGLLIFKPHLGICLPFVLLALGRRDTFLAAGITVVSLLALTLPIVGIDAWASYLNKVAPYHAADLKLFDGFYTHMMVSVWSGLRAMGLEHYSALSVQAMISLPVLITTIFAVRRTNDPLLRTMVVVTAVPLITPYAFNYDLTASAAVIAWLLLGPFELPRKFRLLLMMPWLVPVLVMIPDVQATGLPQAIMIGLFTLTASLAWGWVPRPDAERQPTATQTA